MLVIECTLQGQLDGKYFHCMFSVKESFPNKSFCHQHKLYCWSEDFGFHYLVPPHKIIHFLCLVGVH